MWLCINSPLALPIMQFVFILYFVAMFYFLSRVSVVFPAIAVDNEQGIQWAWRLTKNNGLRLMLAIYILPGVIEIPVNYLLAGGNMYMKMANDVFEVLYIIFAISVLSVSYKHLIKNAESRGQTS